MLSQLKRRLECHLQAVSSSANSLCQKPMATMMTIVVIAVALALPALFWVISDNTAKLTQVWQKGGYISLYLKTGLSEQVQEQVLTTVRNTPGVGKANLISAAAGLDSLTNQEGMQDILKYLPDNPLPPVIEVMPAVNVDSVPKVDALLASLKTNPAIDQAKMDMEWIGRLQMILGFSSKAAHALMILLASAVILIVGNTLRSAVYHRQEEIQVLKLIGATDAYIVRPFLYAGIWYGLAGAIVAVLLVNIFISTLGLAFNQLASVYEMHFPLAGLDLGQMIALLSFAVVLGWVGGKLSVHRQLATIEP